MYKGRVIAVVAIVVIFLASLWISKKPGEGAKISDKDSGPVVVEVVSGEVEVAASGSDEWKKVDTDYKITVGTRVRTGAQGRAKLKYPNGSVTRLDYNSQVELEEFSESPQRVRVQISTGRIWQRVSKILGKEEYASQSQNVVAAVRGTSYGHSLLDNQFDQIISREDPVDVECKEDSQKGQVNEGYMGRFDCDGDAPDITKTGEQDKDEWFKFNQEQDELLDKEYPDGRFNHDHGQALGVTNLSDGSLPGAFVPRLDSPSPTPGLIDCVGPDGKTARASQADCDNLWAFWNSHPPAGWGGSPDSGIGGPRDSGSTQPSATPIPVTIVALSETTCTYPCLSEVTVSGSGFGAGILGEAVDALLNAYSTLSLIVNSPTQLTLQFDSLSCSNLAIHLWYLAPDGREATSSATFSPSFC